MGNEYRSGVSFVFLGNLKDAEKEVQSMIAAHESVIKKQKEGYLPTFRENVSSAKGITLTLSTLEEDIGG